MGDFPFKDPEETRYDGPTLIIRGTKSHYVADDVLPVIGRFFPRFELRDIDCGHWFVNSRMFPWFPYQVWSWKPCPSKHNTKTRQLTFLRGSADSGICIRVISEKPEAFRQSEYLCATNSTRRLNLYSGRGVFTRETIRVKVSAYNGLMLVYRLHETWKWGGWLLSGWWWILFSAIVQSLALKMWQVLKAKSSNAAHIKKLIEVWDWLAFNEVYTWQQAVRVGAVFTILWAAVKQFEIVVRWRPGTSLIISVAVTEASAWKIQFKRIHAILFGVLQSKIDPSWVTLIQTCMLQSAQRLS